SSFAMPVPGYVNRDVGNAPYWILEGLQPGTRYYARARTYDSAGNLSPYTPVVSMATLYADYAAQSTPISVALSNPTSSSLSLSWAQPTSNHSINVATYHVQVSKLADFADCGPWTGLFYQPPTTRVVLTGLVPATRYYVRVRALDTYGNASNYVAASAATSGESVLPPSNLHYNYPTAAS